MTTDYQDGFILHSRPFRESSQLLEVFTRRDGRVSILVKGSRRRRSKLSGVLQAFSLLNVSWSGKGQLKNLRMAEAQTQVLPLPGDRLYLGLYLNELLYRLLEHLTPYPLLFQHYQNALLALAQSDDFEPILRKFELQLFEALGFAVDFRQTADSGEPIRAGYTYQYVKEFGFVLRGSGQSGSHLYLGEHIDALARQKFCSSDELRAGKRFCRTILAGLLGDKPLHSRELFIQRKKRLSTRTGE